MYKLRRFTIITTMAAVLFVSQSQAQSQPTKKGVKNIVLVHGAFADGSSWERIIPILHGKGYSVIAVQNPLTSLDDDVAATRRAIASMDGPVLLVAHSYGGMVATEAGNDPKVSGLVYICALVPDEGQSANDVVKAFPPQPGFAEFRQEGGFLTLSYKGVHEDFAQDLPFQVRNTIYSVQVPWGVSATDRKVPVVAWKSRQSWFIIGKQDRLISPALERAEAKMIGARTLELNSSHVPMISRPEEVAAFIVKAAQER